MPLLVVVSFIWAFSPGLIKGRLGGLDSAFISAARLGLALLVFLPFLRLGGITVRAGAGFALIGAVQFGVMYLAYNESFRFLQAYEVVLFTITTPILVTLLADAFDRQLRPRALLAALLAVVGAAFIVAKARAVNATLTGFALVQLSNLAFAVGQVWYRRLMAAQRGVRDRDVFALLYAGAFAVALAAVLPRGVNVTLTGAQVQTLLYLGILASGVGFFLWNAGATRVGTGTLAVMNNLKVPLSVICSLVFFGEQVESVPRLLAATACLAVAVWLAEQRGSRRP